MGGSSRGRNIWPGAALTRLIRRIRIISSYGEIFSTIFFSARMGKRLFNFPEMERVGGEFETLTVDIDGNPTFPIVAKVGGGVRRGRAKVACVPVSGPTARNPRGALAKWISKPHQSDVLREYTGSRRTLYGQIYSESKVRSSILRGRPGLLLRATTKRPFPNIR